MDTVQISDLENHLLELRDPNTTPEMALQYLSSPCLSYWGNSRGYGEPVVIFLAYINFIMKNQPDGCVVGIWEEIFGKVVLYSRNFTDVKNEIRRMRMTYLSNIYKRVIPIDGPLVNKWLYKTLNNHIKCPNPYIRLELFRMLRIFHKENRNWTIWERISDTLIHTISQIQPHLLIENGDVGEVLFGVNDLNYTINRCCGFGNLYSMMKTNLVNLVTKYSEEIVKTKETKFISHCIQLIGIFADKAGSIPGPGSRENKIQNCFSVFRIIRNLVNCGRSLPGLYELGDNQVRYVLSLPAFHHYVVKTFCDLTTAIINNKTGRDIRNLRSLINERDDLTYDLDVFTKNSDLPRLLLHRQVQGSRLVHQKILMLRNLYTFSEKDCDANALIAINKILNRFGNIANESIDNDRIDNDIIDNESVNSESIDNDRIENDIIDSESVNSESIDNDSMDSESVNSESIDNDSMDSESVNSDSIDNDRIDNDIIDSEIVNSESIDNDIIENDIIGSESVNSESIDNDSMDSESVNSESIDNDTYDSESVNSESIDNDSMDSESNDSESRDYERSIINAYLGYRYGHESFGDVNIGNESSGDGSIDNESNANESTGDESNDSNIDLAESDEHESTGNESDID